jgi:hypothetical protein
VEPTTGNEVRRLHESCSIHDIGRYEGVHQHSPEFTEKSYPADVSNPHDYSRFLNFEVDRIQIATLAHQ